MLRLCYLIEEENKTVDTGTACTAEEWDVGWRKAWLADMVNSNPDVNFFMVTETTDIWQEIK